MTAVLRPKAGASRPSAPTRIVDLALRLTYELYLDSGDGQPVFEALTCADEVELIGAMRRILAERKLRSIEARRFGELVMTLQA